MRHQRVENWKIEITRQGPALYDNHRDCHGMISPNKDFQRNGNVFSYISNYCVKQSVQTTVYLNLDDVLELFPDNIHQRDVAKQIYFCEPRLRS